MVPGNLASAVDPPRNMASYLFTSWCRTGLASAEMQRRRGRLQFYAKLGLWNKTLRPCSTDTNAGSCSGGKAVSSAVLPRLAAAVGPTDKFHGGLSVARRR